MIVSAIAAVAENDVIGKDNALIWHLPKDLKFFKDTTKGHYVIMGRRNYHSIPPKYRPFPNRVNVIVTRQADFEAPGCLVVHSIEEGIDVARKAGETEAFIIGGGEIYRQALEKDLVDRLYITWVHAEFEGDTWFPKFDRETWREMSRQTFRADADHRFDFSICVYEKRDGLDKC